MKNVVSSLGYSILYSALSHGMEMLNKIETLFKGLSVHN